VRRDDAGPPPAFEADPLAVPLAVVPLAVVPLGVDVLAGVLLAGVLLAVVPFEVAALVVVAFEVVPLAVEALAVVPLVVGAFFVDAFVVVVVVVRVSAGWDAGADRPFALFVFAASAVDWLRDRFLSPSGSAPLTALTAPLANPLTPLAIFPALRPTCSTTLPGSGICSPPCVGRLAERPILDGADAVPVGHWTWADLTSDLELTVSTLALRRLGGERI
jgi:hypothetical protein